MSSAIGIAARALVCRASRATIVALLSSMILTACGGGAGTTANPLSQDPGNGNNTVYTGPVARDADVRRLVLVHTNPLTETDDPIGLDIARAIFPNTEIGTDRMELTF